MGAAVWGFSPRFEQNRRLLARCRHKSEGNVYCARLNPRFEGNPEVRIKNEIWFCLATNRHQQWDCWKKKPAIPQSAGRSPFTLDFLCCDDRCTSTRSCTAKSPDSGTHTHTHTPLPHPPPAAPENALSMMSPAIPALQREQKGSPQ